VRIHTYNTHKSAISTHSPTCTCCVIRERHFLRMLTSFLTSFLPLAMRLRSRSRRKQALCLHFRSRDKQSGSSRRPTLTSSPAEPMTHAVPSHHGGFLAATIVATTIAMHAGGTWEKASAGNRHGRGRGVTARGARCVPIATWSPSANAKYL
jgi:hypothetical protein